jgi:hypothetical protein
MAPCRNNREVARARLRSGEGVDRCCSRLQVELIASATTRMAIALAPNSSGAFFS